MMNKVRFAMKRYREKIKPEKKQIQLNKKIVKREKNRKQKTGQLEKELKKI